MIHHKFKFSGIFWESFFFYFSLSPSPFWHSIILIDYVSELKLNYSCNHLHLIMTFTDGWTWIYFIYQIGFSTILLRFFHYEIFFFHLLLNDDSMEQISMIYYRFQSVDDVQFATAIIGIWFPGLLHLPLLHSVIKK